MSGYAPWRGGFNESLVLGIADALVRSGLRDKGFVYVNLDCGPSWHCSASSVH